MLNIKRKHLSAVKFLLMGAVLILSVNSAHANVGKIVYGYGSNYALDTNGNRRDLKRGDEIREGDTLVTGRGRMHVRLIDGGFVSVYPNSEYRIDKFKFSGKKKTDESSAVSNKKIKPVAESKEDRGFFSLLKGAARQVTGLLGRTYNKNFKFKTSVATIGIRGTGFFARLCQADCFDADGNPLQDGLHVKNNTGIITVKTNAGEVSLAQGQSAFAASSEEPPQQTVQPPISRNYVTPDIELFDFDEKVVDVDRGREVDVVVPVNPPVVPQVAVTKLEYVTTSTVFSNEVLLGLDTTNGSDSLIQNGDAIERFSGLGADGFTVFDKGTGTLSESGSDSTLGVLWNRWTGGFTYSDSGSSIVSLDDNVHLVGSDNITSVMPGSTRGRVLYQSTGGTSPTITGAAGNQVGVQTITAELDFISGVVNTFQINATFSNADILANLVSPFNLNGSTSGNIIPLSGTCLGTGCTSVTSAGVTGNASVNLVGPDAEGIYGIYNLITTDTGKENAVSGSYVAAEQPAISPL